MANNDFMPMGKDMGIRFDQRGLFSNDITYAHLFIVLHRPYGKLCVKKSGQSESAPSF